MKTLNLVNLEASDIKYKISKFPDGQQDVIILDPKKIAFSKHVRIISRMSDFKDLELIACAKAALDNLFIDTVILYAPYILGARSDRQFEDGGTSYLEQVVGPILNQLEFKKIECVDVHSPKAEMWINRLTSKNNLEFVDWAIKDLISEYTAEYKENIKGRFAIVCPDKGAIERTERIMKLPILKEVPMVRCKKVRSVDGKLSNTETDLNLETVDREYIIVDDICDGGRTFINIAEKLKKATPGCCIYLLTTHGIYSNGFDELNQYFTRIYCTDSVKSIGTVAYDGWKNKSTKVRQFKLYDKV